MSKVLTVVIPSYNVEAYLADTLESFISEEIMEDVEVLIVNDGSKDSTPEIAEQFEQRYPQTFRLINKKTGGMARPSIGGWKKQRALISKWSMEMTGSIQRISRKW